MLVSPVPVILSIVIFEFGKIARFTVVFFGIDMIRLIFLTVPFMVVIVLFVVVSASGILLGPQQSRRQCHWAHKRDTQQDGIPETGHNWVFSSLVNRQS